MLVCRQGKAIERFAQMTNWNYYEAARRFQKVRCSGCKGVSVVEGTRPPAVQLQPPGAQEAVA